MVIYLNRIIAPPMIFSHSRQTGSVAITRPISAKDKQDGMFMLQSTKKLSNKKSGTQIHHHIVVYMV